MPNPENIKGKGFDARPENINRAGRPKGSVSLKRALKRMLAKDGQIAIEKKHVVREDERYIYIKAPTPDVLMYKLMSMALSKNTGVSMRALKLIMEYIDGKPMQTLEISGTEPVQGIALKLLTPDADTDETDKEKK